MRRREFITLLGGAAASWPLAAHAQKPDRIRRIGVLIGNASSAEDPIAKEILQQFRSAMQEAGWIDGKNIRLDYRFGGDVTTINASAAELVALAPEVIYGTGLPAARALHQKTQTIPIVFTQVADPVGFGLVETLGHPGGNVTGFIVGDLSIGGKWIQLLRDIAPELTRIRIIYSPHTAPYAPPLIASAKAAAGSNVAVIEFTTRDDKKEIEAAASVDRPRATMVGFWSYQSHSPMRIGIRSLRKPPDFSLPALNPVSGAVERGALISYT